jgi:RNA polymerase sigma-70 factor (ECF subfamily)
LRSSMSSDHRAALFDVGQAVARAHLGEPDMLSALMRQHNRRMFRIARAILRNDAEAEDIVQDAFVKAFTELDTLRDPGSVAAWLARITANLAISRIRLLKRRGRIVLAEGELKDRPDYMESDQRTPERLTAISDVRRLLERAIDRLPDGYREVFMLRVVEQMSVEETASTLGILAQTVKSRLHRAKAMLRSDLEEHLTTISLTVFPFGGARCQKVTDVVLVRLNLQMPDRTTILHH